MALLLNKTFSEISSLRKMKERLNQRLLQPFEHDTVGQWGLCRENRINGKYLTRNIKYFLSQETKLCLHFKIAPKSFDMNWNLSNHIQQDIHITGVGFCKGLVTAERKICSIWFEAQFTIDHVAFEQIIGKVSFLSFSFAKLEVFSFPSSSTEFSAA